MTIPVARRIFESYEQRAKSYPRRHLGASGIGEECERKLWLAFRWAAEERHEGRILRLFETGKLEERRVLDDLAQTGFVVEPFDPVTGNQFSVFLFGGHFGGSCDGIAEDPDTGGKFIVEIKTHNARSFSSLVKHGVRKSKPQHFAQMQMYLGFFSLRRALYIAVDKNTDAIHDEWVEFDPEEFERLKRKAERVIFSPKPPRGVSTTPEFFQCRMCHFSAQCHAGELPAVNCRTCLHSTPEPSGGWGCERHGRPLSTEAQVTGCSEHLFVPGLLPWRQVDVTADGVLYEGGWVNRRGGRFEKQRG
jgi:CRISPR/Cas system-associated exonuclease Cas4 (RecB family)